MDSLLVLFAVVVAGTCAVDVALLASAGPALRRSGRRAFAHAALGLCGLTAAIACLITPLTGEPLLAAAAILWSVAVHMAGWQLLAQPLGVAR